MKGSENPNTRRRANRGRGRGRGRGQRSRQQQHPQQPNSSTGTERKILVLHGSRQSGQLLLGRLDKLRKALQKECHNTQLVAPDAPFDHPEDVNLRQWWDRHENAYQGLETSLGMLHDLWESCNGSMEGILGFSQGARLAHLIALMHQMATNQNNHDSRRIPFQGLRYVILVAGYDAPIPDNWESALQTCFPDVKFSTTKTTINIPSLHIWGLSDPIIPPEQSQVVMKSYQNPISHPHDGGHHVPVKANIIPVYIGFIKQVSNNQVNNCDSVPSESTVVEEQSIPPNTTTKVTNDTAIQKRNEKSPPPDEETAMAQQDEVDALTAIYPEEVTMISKVTTIDETGENTYQHPISYQIALHPEDEATPGGHWPKHPLFLKITYPHNYPSEEALPHFQLVHENNVMEFPSAKVSACMRAVQEAAESERGMPCVLSCFYAAREFLDAGEDVEGLSIIDTDDAANTMETNSDEAAPSVGDRNSEESVAVGSTLLKQASPERIHQCNMEGLAIAEALLGRAPPQSTTAVDSVIASSMEGLAGAPLLSGKSTFFNTASGFARQKDDADNVLGGATMAPHPFTTIDPNIGFCLVPAPKGSCPEEDIDKTEIQKLNIGSTHGRDALGRRLVPVLLKDVAGLVPGAYQGRGRGNKFLNDLTDADVLVHVVDASGTADSEGNAVGEDEGTPTRTAQPLKDLAWIRNELIEWVFTNLMHKWDSVTRRGRSKLSGMFSGYGQTAGFLSDVLYAVEKHMENTEQRDHAMDHLDEWDTGDVHRLVSAFLGVRFPMALALNKYDMPSSIKHVQSIQAALPLHGAHVGVPLSARSEMTFIRHHMLQQRQSSALQADKTTAKKEDRQIPHGTWQCLQSAMSLREPILVFPVSDFTTYQPLPGLTKNALGDPSLPSAGMIACLQAAGGSAPTLWDSDQRIYALQSSSTTTTSTGNSGSSSLKNSKQSTVALRDVLLMKPGSTVEDVFLSLKRLGALGGDFVRAEGAGKIHETSKQIKKDTIVGQHCRILKIMTTKRSQWQQQYARGASSK